MANTSHERIIKLKDEADDLKQDQAAKAALVKDAQTALEEIERELEEWSNEQKSLDEQRQRCRQLFDGLVFDRDKIGIGEYDDVVEALIQDDAARARLREVHSGKESIRDTANNRVDAARKNVDLAKASLDEARTGRVRLEAALGSADPSPSHSAHL